MLLINFRKFKFKWQMMLLIMPLLLIPIILLIVLNIGLFNYFEKEKISSNASIILEISRNIDKEIAVYLEESVFQNILAKEASVKIENILTQESNLYNKGIIYILNKDMKSIYTNKAKFEEDQKVKTDDALYLENENVKNILQNNPDKTYKNASKSMIFNSSFKGSNYYVFVLDSKKLDYTTGIKFLYFMPKKEITSSIAPFILWILFFTLIILGVIVLFFFKFSDFIIFPITNLDYATKKASEGYLNINIVSDSEDEIAKIYHNLKDMISSYKDYVTKISKSSQNMSGFHKSFEKILNMFDESLKKQLKFVSGNINTFSELNNILMKSTQNIKEGNNIIKQAEINSNNSTSLINEMVDEINKISNTSREISFIIELINSISEKTRLLSVNSAIEASRAGEAGKGFAVVATEIRKLAMQTKDASSKISELIKSNENIINSGVNKTYEVISALKSIDSSIKFMSNIMERLNNSIQDGRKKAYDVMNVSKNFSSATTENFNFLTSINKYKMLINSEIEKINDQIKRFTLDPKESETIRDIKVYNPFGSESAKAFGESLKNLSVFDKSKKDKSTAVKSIALYKQKKGIFGKDKK